MTECCSKVMSMTDHAIQMINTDYDKFQNWFKWVPWCQFVSCENLPKDLCRRHMSMNNAFRQVLAWHKSYMPKKGIVLWQILKIWRAFLWTMQHKSVLCQNKHGQRFSFLICYWILPAALLENRKTLKVKKMSLYGFSDASKVRLYLNRIETKVDGLAEKQAQLSIQLSEVSKNHYWS